MAPSVLLFFVLGYFVILLIIAYFTTKKSSGNNDFFIANRSSKWYLVAVGMIGTTVSGVTFISVPGTVGTDGFAYFQFVIGNIFGYIIIATILLPIYYRLNLISIYGYLEKRFGFWSYKTGAFFFLISRVLGSSFRLFLVVLVLQHFILDSFGVPFWVTVAASLLLIWTYTFRGGLKTIIITDSLQTIFLLASVIITIFIIGERMNLTLGGLADAVFNSHYSKVFFVENFTGNTHHFIKYFVGGIGVTVAMTGIDQDLMQKNLSCKNLSESKKNMFWFTGAFVFVNIFFLSVGALLYIYAKNQNIPIPNRSDFIFPEIAFNHLGAIGAIVFILGLTAATFATTDSALTALTTSFCIDFLGMGKDRSQNDQVSNSQQKRKIVHVIFSLVFLLVVILFKYLISESVVKAIFMVATFTYGPLLGIFMFGILTKNYVRDRWVPFICLLSPVICWILDKNSTTWLWGYKFSFELIILNGLITFLGLMLISKKRDNTIVRTLNKRVMH